MFGARQDDHEKASTPAIEVQTPDIEEENENERLLLFSDGVIAVTLTLATISIRLPAGKEYTNLSEFLTDLGPYLLTYLIGFVIVGSYWYEHWRFFRYITRSSTALVVRNLIFLASLVFLPFLSHYYGGNFYLSGDQENTYLAVTTLLFYTFLLISGIFLLNVWRYARRRHRLIYEDLDAKIVRNTTLRLLRNPLAIIIYLVAFLFLPFSIVTSILPVIVFLVIWESARRFYMRKVPSTKPTDTQRIVIFSDCVMAIAITLVAAQLELPELKFGSGINEVITEPVVMHLATILLIYLAAFINIGIHWMSHYHMFRSIKRSDIWLVVLNFAFLLCITLLFLPTSASIEYPNLFTSRLYYVTQTATALLLVFIWVYAVQKHRLIDATADSVSLRRTSGRLVRNLLIFAGLALLTLVFSMQIDILAYFWVYLLLEFAVFVIRRTRLFLQRRKLAIAAKSNIASLKK
ncbi:MAG TPA: TMEM175 family protein [Ktedonobacteraceae bacterium]|nr:TMEM175 family protein [Ktedonobacteraceae bacterium]